jgi:hypothetical protein
MTAKATNEDAAFTNNPLKARLSGRGISNGVSKQSAKKPVPPALKTNPLFMAINAPGKRARQNSRPKKKETPAPITRAPPSNPSKNKDEKDNRNRHAPNRSGGYDNHSTNDMHRMEDDTPRRHYDDVPMEPRAMRQNNNAQPQHRERDQNSEPRNYSIKYASQPPIVQIRNLDPGTTAEDVKAVLEQIGPVDECRTRDTNDAVVAEIMFLNKDDATVALQRFDKSYADGRLLSAKIIRQYTIPEYVAEIRPVEAPVYVSSWEGPPLYSDSVDRHRRR